MWSTFSYIAFQRMETTIWADRAGEKERPLPVSQKGFRLTARLPLLAFGSRPSGTGLWPVR